MSRAYGWRASCPAGGVTVVGVGSGAWFGSVFIWLRLVVVEAIPSQNPQLSVSQSSSFHLLGSHYE